jgi:hypothetical protein
MVPTKFKSKLAENLLAVYAYAVVTALLAAGTDAISDPNALKTILVGAIPAVLVVVKGLLAKRVGDPDSPQFTA